MILAPILTAHVLSANFGRNYQPSGLAWLAPPLAAGPMTDTQPISPEPGAGVSGVLSWSYFDEFYHRIHVNPPAIALGNVTSSIYRTVEVWNAHFVARTLQAINASGTTGGLTLSGQAAPPLIFGPLQSRLYTLAALAAGDPVIDASYRFDFVSEEPVLTVTGRRIVIWPIAPDWSAGITERLEWLTDVITAYDGTEQRVRLRDHARRSIEYGYLAHGHDARLLEALTFGWGARVYCLPVWWEADVLASALAAGASSVTVTDAALKDYRVGALAVFWRDTGVCEAVEIDAIAEDTITLKQTLSQTFPAGSRVMPALLARLDGEASYRHVTDRIVEGRARFLSDSNFDRTPAEIGQTWEGYTVLDERPDRADDVDETWARTLTVLDNLTGIIMTDDTSGSPVVRRTYHWLIAGRAAIDRWKKWAAARAGKHKALWLPTFADDLEVIQAIGSGDTNLRVKNTLSARYVGAHPLRAAVRIELASGQVFHRRVTGITELDALTESIGIDQSLGMLVQPADIRRVMWMGLARLDADAIEIHYETDSVARLAVTFRMVSQ